MATRKWLDRSEPLAGAPETWMTRLLDGTGVTLDALRAGAVRWPKAVRVPFADGVFATPSGKVELPGSFAPGEPPDDGALHLVATKTLKMVNSQILPGDQPAAPVARAHPETLRALGLREGEAAFLESATASVGVTLAADATLRRDVVLLNPALWRGDASGIC